MGIELSGFRNAIAQDGQFLSVSGQDLSEVKATDLKLEQVQDPTGMNQAASNIYLRGQLLTGIRESLLSSKLMCVARDPANANKEILVFQDKNVQKFFEDAEKQLFGVVSTKGKNKGQYGIATASQNLESQTVKDLIARLNEMMPPAGKPQVEQKNDNINNINNINNVNNKPDDEVIVLGGGNSNPFDLEGSENVRIEAQRPPVEEMSERNPVDSDVLIESKEESGHVEDDFGLVPKNMRSKDDVVPVGAKEVEKEGTVTIKTVSGERTETYEWELYDVPDAELTAAQRLFREKQPNVTDRQRAAMTNPDFGKLAACLKQDVSIVKNLQLSDVEPMANGRDFVCTLALSGGAGSVRVLVAPDGQFVNYADYQKCREILQESPDAFAATDLRDVAHVMSFMRTKDGDDPIGEFKLYSSTLKAMLPTALAKARQTVPEGDIPLSVWWNALGFEGAAPADDSTRYQGKVSFLKALQQRAMDDYNAAMGKADTN